MKIIDENKLMGYPLSKIKIDKIRIILYQRIKKIANGEKILLIKKKNNPFYINKKLKMKNENFDDFFKIRKIIINQKIKKGEIEYIEFNSYDKKIKNLGYFIGDITEINSTDPRLFLLWNYNKNIKINVWFKNINIDKYFKEEFKKIFFNFDLSSEKDWKKFLYFFSTKNNPAIKGLGWKTLIKEMNNKENKNINDINRIKNVSKLIEEMA